MDWKFSFSIVESLTKDPAYIQQLFLQFGLDRWAYQNTALNSEVETNYPDVWIEHYISSDYFHVDPVSLKSYEAKEAFSWNITTKGMFISNKQVTDNLEKELISVSEVQKQFLAEASDVGLNHGLLIPISDDINLASYAFSPLSMSEKEIQFWCAEYLEQLKFICNVNYQIHKPQVKDDVNITKKEREVIYWLSEGKSSWDIAKIMNITERTANYHVTNIKKKLQASNRSQIISAAFRNKIVV